MMEAMRGVQSYTEYNLVTEPANLLEADLQVSYKKKKLFSPLLMPVLSQSFFTFMRRYLMTLPFFTTRHTQIIF